MDQTLLPRFPVSTFFLVNATGGIPLFQRNRSASAVSPHIRFRKQSTDYGRGRSSSPHRSAPHSLEGQIHGHLARYRSRADVKSQRRGRFNCRLAPVSRSMSRDLVLHLNLARNKLPSPQVGRSGGDPPRHVSGPGAVYCQPSLVTDLPGNVLPIVGPPSKQRSGQGAHTDRLSTRGQMALRAPTLDGSKEGVNACSYAADTNRLTVGRPCWSALQGSANRATIRAFVPSAAAVQTSPLLVLPGPENAIYLPSGEIAGRPSHSRPHPHSQLSFQLPSARFQILIARAWPGGAGGGMGGGGIKKQKTIQRF